MNIFYVSKDPCIAAISLCDKHVVKMIVESAQMLSTAHRVLDEEQFPNKELFKHIYKATHKNHPCNVWVRESISNYNWLFQHFDILMKEYTRRYNKTHACNKLCHWLYSAPIKINWNKEFFDPPACMPDEFKVNNDAVKSYRNYYNVAKKHIHRWTNRNPPVWIKGILDV